MYVPRNVRILWDDLKLISTINFKNNKSKCLWYSPYRGRRWNGGIYKSTEKETENRAIGTDKGKYLWELTILGLALCWQMYGDLI